eukprot:scaffold48610_cov43-Prasinocladus_malaysianus.AAC.1
MMMRRSASARPTTSSRRYGTVSRLSTPVRYGMTMIPAATCTVLLRFQVVTLHSTRTGST